MDQHKTLLINGPHWVTNCQHEIFRKYGNQVYSERACPHHKACCRSQSGEGRQSTGTDIPATRVSGIFHRMAHIISDLRYSHSQNIDKHLQDLPVCRETCLVLSEPYLPAEGHGEDRDQSLPTAFSLQLVKKIQCPDSRTCAHVCTCTCLCKRMCSREGE